MAKKKSSSAKTATPPAKQSLDDFVANWSDDYDSDDNSDALVVKPIANGNSKNVGKVQNGAKKGLNGSFAQNGKSKTQNGKAKPQSGLKQVNRLIR